MFQRPVEIGSLLFLTASVIYVEGNRIQTRVNAQVVDIHTTKRETTNIFYFIFKTQDSTKPLTNVVPKTYAGKICLRSFQSYYLSINHIRSLFRGNDVFRRQTTS